MTFDCWIATVKNLQTFKMFINIIKMMKVELWIVNHCSDFLYIVNILNVFEYTKLYYVPMGTLMSLTGTCKKCCDVYWKLS